jgi:hypothetical protein
MGNMPGHVKVTVPAGGMALFDQRCWVRSVQILARSSASGDLWEMHHAHVLARPFALICSLPGGVSSAAHRHAVDERSEP